MLNDQRAHDLAVKKERVNAQRLAGDVARLAEECDFWDYRDAVEDVDADIMDIRDRMLSPKYAEIAPVMDWLKDIRHYEDIGPDACKLIDEIDGLRARLGLENMLESCGITQITYGNEITKL